MAERNKVNVFTIDKVAIVVWSFLYFIICIQGFFVLDLTEFIDTFIIYPGLAALFMIAFEYYKTDDSLFPPDKVEWSIFWAYVYLLFPIVMMLFVFFVVLLVSSYSKVYWVITTTGLQIGYELACVLKWRNGK